VADRSVPLALITVIACYVVSALATLALPRLAAVQADAEAGITVFVARIRTLFVLVRARFAMLGNSLFWASGAVLRVLLVAWAAKILGTENSSDVADLTLFLAFGIVLGALIVPRLIPIAHLRRARLAAYAMGVAILLFSLATEAGPARAVLVMIGLCGGMFLVPINAALQDIGHRTIGSGRAVALQSFFENFAMLTGVGIYTGAVGLGAQPVASIVVVGVLVLIATTLVSWRLPPDPAADSAVLETAPDSREP
jgi:LPLT family lysophospholipid transporter-like MFS transporter